MLNEFDKNILFVMLHDISIFKRNEPTFETLYLINQSLGALLNSLREINEEWVESFRSQWGELEFTTALMIDREKNYLSEEDKKAVFKAINNMEKMIHDLVSNPEYSSAKDL